MRKRVLLGLILVTVACGDNKRGGTPIDGSTNPPIDAAIGTDTLSPDANAADLIGAAKGTADGTGLSLPIAGAMVTYVKPQVGSATNDPAGFTIQASQMGPALFVAVDAMTTTPPLSRGDVVSFTITALATTGGQKRATAITGLVRHSTGANFALFSQNITAATDLVTAIDNYESELVDVTGTVPGMFVASGAGFEKTTFHTTGISGTPTFVLRVPAALREEIDLVPTCTVTLDDTPIGRFNTETQLTAFNPNDIALSNCPAPVLVSATDVSATSVRLTFSRHIDPGSVLGNGSQFTLDGGLTVTGATVSGKTITLTTSAQTGGTAYNVTAIANTVKDRQGSPVTPLAANVPFTGFETPAGVRINEVNANITTGCDLIELRVTSNGTLRNVRVQERTGASGELQLDLPNVSVAKNDIIVIHLNSGNATCNPGASTNETTSITQQPTATFARNYDTAWDVFSTDTGLTATDNVITLFDRFGTMTDVVLIDDDIPASMTPNNVAAASETAAAAAVVANQWQNVGGGTPAGGYVDDNFRLHAVVDSDATGTAAAGDSLRRIDDTDDNNKADWAQGASTFGLINAGQAPL